MAMSESPLFRGRAVPAHDAPMMIIRRERAAIGAMAALRAVGADPLPTHRLPNGLGYIAPDTGLNHGPTSRPDGRDCGCGWGDLCTGVRIGTFSEVYSLCGATRYFPHKVAS